MKMTTCNNCDGTGVCPECEGAKTIDDDDHCFGTADCPECNGDGDGEYNEYTGGVIYEF